MALIPAAPRHFYSVASAVLVATLLATLSVGACGGDDTASATDASGDETIKLLCQAFSGSGNPCSPVSSQVCFAMCAKGGCRCVASPNGGGGIWKCDTDESCYPGGPDFEAGPQDDGSVPPTDASTEASAEASTDAATDATDATDADAGD